MSELQLVTNRQLKNHHLDLTKVSLLSNASTLGKNTITKKPVLLTDQEANFHTLVIGTTGAGKTTVIGNIIESAIERNISLFYIDGKGDKKLAQSIKTYALEKNRPFYLFSMVEDTLKYNPLASGGYTSKKDRLIELRTWSEEHYRKIAESYLQSVFKILEALKIPIDIFLLAKYLNPDDLYQLARSTKDRSLANEIAMLEEKRKDITGLLAEIENLIASDIGHLFDCSTGEVLILEEAFNKNAIVYFCLQPLAYPVYADTLGKLIINDLKNLIAMQLNSNEKQLIYTIFDEFSIFAGEQIINLINQGRAAGVCAVLGTQSLSDIIRKGGQALLGQVLNNCNNFIILRQNNPQDANILADIIGSKESLESTLQIHSMNLSNTYLKLARSYIIHPDQIKRLIQGQGILLKKQTFSVEHVEFHRGQLV